MKTITAENAKLGCMIFLLIDNNVYECKIVERKLQIIERLINNQVAKEKILDLTLDFKKGGSVYIKKLAFSDSQLNTELPLDKEALFKILCDAKHVNYYEK